VQSPVGREAKCGVPCGVVRANHCISVRADAHNLRTLDWGY